VALRLTGVFSQSGRGLLHLPPAERNVKSAKHAKQTKEEVTPASSLLSSFSDPLFEAESNVPTVFSAIAWMARRFPW
jgi:hypothetical protein